MGCILHGRRKPADLSATKCCGIAESVLSVRQKLPCSRPRMHRQMRRSLVSLQVTSHRAFKHPKKLYSWYTESPDEALAHICLSAHSLFCICDNISTCQILSALHSHLQMSLQNTLSPFSMLMLSLLCLTFPLPRPCRSRWTGKGRFKQCRRMAHAVTSSY